MFCYAYLSNNNHFKGTDQWRKKNANRMRGRSQCQSKTFLDFGLSSALSIESIVCWGAWSWELDNEALKLPAERPLSTQEPDIQSLRPSSSMQMGAQMQETEPRNKTSNIANYDRLEDCSAASGQ